METTWSLCTAVHAVAVVLEMQSSLRRFMKRVEDEKEAKRVSHVVMSSFNF